MKNNKKIRRTSRLIFLLALISFLITSIQGILFYESYTWFFRILLVLQNSINAFGFKAAVTIKDVFAFMRDNPTILNKIVGYAYCIAIFTAPYCTLSFLYKFLERILRFIVFFRRGKDCRHIVVFGYNDDVRALFENSTFDAKKTCVHIVTKEDVNQEEAYRLNKEGYLIHNVDLLKADETDIKLLLAKTHIEDATNVILFEQSSIRNFSLLQLFRLCEKDDSKRIELSKGTKVSLMCEEEGIGRLIADYYNSATGSDAYFDLELISLPEMQIHKMFSDYPLHTVYKNTDTKLKDWNVHLLVAGFGRLGQEVVLQAMNLGVVHEQNKIIIDVFDNDIKSKKAIFLNQFSKETFDMSDSKLTLKSEIVEGILEINFYECDISHINFYDTVNERFNYAPYTYSVIALENVDLSVNCAMELEEMFAQLNAKIPILMRMDTDRRLAKYISNDEHSLTDVRLIDDKSIIITLDMIINRSIDRIAKNYNHFYNNLNLLSADAKDADAYAANSFEDPECEWNRLKLFRRSSSKAAAYHDEVKEDIIPQLAKETGINLTIKLERLFGPHGILMKYTGIAWQMNGTEEELLNAIENDAFAHALATLEHRRWCYYMSSIGWRFGERNDRFRKNPCLVTWDKLKQTTPEMCKYDLMSLMARYKKTI